MCSHANVCYVSDEAVDISQVQRELKGMYMITILLIFGLFSGAFGHLLTKQEVGGKVRGRLGLCCLSTARLGERMCCACSTAPCGSTVHQQTPACHFRKRGEREVIMVMSKGCIHIFD